MLESPPGRRDVGEVAWRGSLASEAACLSSGEAIDIVCVLLTDRVGQIELPLMTWGLVIVRRGSVNDDVKRKLYFVCI